MSESKVLCEQIIAGGWNYSRIVKRGQKIRFQLGRHLENSAYLPHREELLSLR